MQIKILERSLWKLSVYCWKTAKLKTYTFYLQRGMLMLNHKTQLIAIIQYVRYVLYHIVHNLKERIVSFPRQIYRTLLTSVVFGLRVDVNFIKYVNLPFRVVVLCSLSLLLVKGGHCVGDWFMACSVFGYIRLMLVHVMVIFQ